MARAELIKALGLEVKGTTQVFSSWCESVQTAYERKIRQSRADPDACEMLEQARAVLSHEQCYALYEQIWCGKDLYAVLGLKASCDGPDIKKAFRKLMLKAHSDKRNYDCPRLREQASSDSKRVLRAYDVLSNHRTEYDLRKSFDFDHQCPDSGSEGEEFGFHFDPDAWCAGGSEAEEAPPGKEREPRRSRPKRKPRGQKRRGKRQRREPAPEPQPPVTNQCITLECTLRDLYRGMRRRFTFTKGFKGSDGEWFNRNTMMDLRIPERTAPGVFQKLKAYGEYNHQTKACNDIEICITVCQSGCYKCEGFNLMRTVQVELAVALMGGRFEVSLPDGEVVHCAFGDMLRSGDRRVIAGKGLRLSSGGFGDIICVVEVVYGDWSTRQRQVLGEVIKAIRSPNAAVSLEMMNRVCPLRPVDGSRSNFIF